MYYDVDIDLSDLKFNKIAQTKLKHFVAWAIDLNLLLELMHILTHLSFQIIRMIPILCGLRDISVNSLHTISRRSRIKKYVVCLQYYVFTFNNIFNYVFVSHYVIVYRTYLFFNLEEKRKKRNTIKRLSRCRY